jgi:hypothetical protein
MGLGFRGETFEVLGVLSVRRGQAGEQLER